MAINQRIKELLEIVPNRTIAELARVVDVKASTLRDIIGTRQTKPGFDILRAIIDNKELNVNAEWLMTGVGDMLKSELPEVAEPSIEYDIGPRKNYEFEGAPYYNVDFIGGFDLVINDQTVNPSYYVDFRPYNKPGIIWCNITGSSMEPRINHGDKIAIVEISISDVLFGKIYGIITNAGMRTVKWIVRSPIEDCYRLVPENKDPKFGDYQDIPISSIYKVFLVEGYSGSL